MWTKLIARLTSPLIWRIPGNTARKFRKFALAEDGSMRDLALAARLTESPERAAKYLAHAMDEARHAAAFAARAQSIAGPGHASSEPPRADIEHLYERLGELGFLAFVQHGEQRGRAQFEVYREHFAHVGDRKSASMFERIVDDERRHETYTKELLVSVAGSQARAQAALRRAAAWEAWRRWRRLGRSFARALYTVTMIPVYALLAPFAVLVRWTRRVPKTWIQASPDGK